jgi:hypothetical protein
MKLSEFLQRGLFGYRDNWANRHFHDFFAAAATKSSGA